MTISARAVAERERIRSVACDVFANRLGTPSSISVGSSSSTVFDSNGQTPGAHQYIALPISRLTDSQIQQVVGSTIQGTLDSNNWVSEVTNFCLWLDPDKNASASRVASALNDDQRRVIAEIAKLVKEVASDSVVASRADGVYWFWDALLNQTDAFEVRARCTRELRSLIHTVFERQHPPDAGELVSEVLLDPGERQWLRDSLGGQPWFSLSHQQLLAVSDGFSSGYLTAEAATYYLPAFLSAAIEPEQAELRDALLRGLPRLIDSPVLTLTTEKLAAIWLTAAFIASDTRMSEVNTGQLESIQARVGQRIERSVQTTGE